MVGNERSGSATNYGITLQELRDLMDHKGPEAIERIKTQFTNVEGLCELLHTSVNQGEYLKFNKQMIFWNLNLLLELKWDQIFNLECS